MTSKEAFKTASTSARKRAFKLWLVSSILINKRRRKYGFLLHHYMRWLDDYVDKPGLNPIEKKIFIEKELQLFDNLINGIKVTFEHEEEEIFSYFIDYAKRKNINLASEVRCLMESVSIDAYRLLTRKIFTEKELENYIELQVRTIYKIAYYFLLPSKEEISPRGYTGRIFYYVIGVRDFYEDYEAGFLNISSEDLSKFSIDFQNLSDEQLKKYIKNKYDFFLNLYNEEILFLKDEPIKIRLFWLPAYAVLMVELLRIKYYGYATGILYERKKYIKEIFIFFHSLYLNIKTLFTLFLK